MLFRSSLGQGGRPLVAKALVAGLILIVAVVALVLLLRGPIETRLLRGSDGLFAALIVVLVGFALFGKVPLTLGVLGHEGSTVIVVLNSLRLLLWPAALGQDTTKVGTEVQRRSL